LLELEPDRLFAADLGEQIGDRAADELLFRVAGDLAGARVRKEQLAVDVDDQDPVGRALEEVGVALERLEPPLGLEAREGDLLRLVAQALQDARVAERDRCRVGDGPVERELAGAEGEHVPRAKEEHAHGPAFEHDGQERERAEARGGKPLAHDVKQGMRARVADDERLARRHDFADLGVLGELDGQVAQVLVVARRDDVADVAFVAYEHDAAPLDLRDLGDAPHDGEEDVAEVEARRESLRELEDDLRVALAPLEGVHVLAYAKLSADAGDDLRGAHRLADEIVGAGGERARRFVVALEARHDDDRDVTQRGTRANGPQNRVTVRVWHDQIDEHERRRLARQPLERLAAGRDAHSLEIGCFERVAQKMAGNAVVVDYQDGRALGHDA
jgi:hypothetical protein